MFAQSRQKFACQPTCKFFSLRHVAPNNERVKSAFVDDCRILQTARPTVNLAERLVLVVNVLFKCIICIRIVENISDIDTDKPRLTVDNNAANFPELFMREDLRYRRLKTQFEFAGFRKVALNDEQIKFGKVFYVAFATSYNGFITYFLNVPVYRAPMNCNVIICRHFLEVETVCRIFRVELYTSNFDMKKDRT